MDSYTTNKIQGSAFTFSDLLNRDFLSTNYGQNLELAVKIFESFLESTPPDLARLKDEVKDNNHEQIAFIAHKIKNNFVYIGATSLKEYLNQIEVAANENSSDTRKLFADFYTEYVDLLPLIKEEYKRIAQHLNN